jgi:hypothetical protein
MITDKTPIEKIGPRDEKDLEVSFGKPIPQPHLKKGEFVAFGELAGSTATAPSVEGLRTTTFTESVAENSKNL